MPTQDLKVQGDGAFHGYASIVGAATAAEAVDDSATTIHDSDATYFVLGNPTGAGRIVSFRMFDGAEHLVASSIVLRLSAKKSVAAPEVFIGFNKGGAQVYHASSYLPGASFNPVITRTFNTNPFNNQPWTAEDLVGLEPCLMMADFTFAACWVSLLSGQATYMEPHNYDIGSDRQGAALA